MLFTPLQLADAYTIELEPIHDHRGFNARQWCVHEFAAHGLETKVAQTNIIRNTRRGTLRGFHYQVPPKVETKVFRVTRGAIFDVIIDLRRGSGTYGEWTSVELSADSYTMLYVPAGFAQAFQTLEADTELTYQVSEYYSPAFGRGIRYDDPAFAIPWPLEVSVISEQDRHWPDFKDGSK